MTKNQRGWATFLLAFSFVMICWIPAMLLSSYDLQEIPHIYSIIIDTILFQRASYLILKRDHRTSAHNILVLFTAVILIQLPFSHLLDGALKQVAQIFVILICVVNALFHLGVIYVIWRREVSAKNVAA